MARNNAVDADQDETITTDDVRRAIPAEDQEDVEISVMRNGRGDGMIVLAHDDDPIESHDGDYIVTERVRELEDFVRSELSPVGVRYRHRSNAIGFTFRADVEE